MTPRARVAAIQTSPAFGEVERNLEEARALAAGFSADLVVFPELFATGYQIVSRDEAFSLAEPAAGGRTVAVLEEIARETGATVVAGLLELARDPGEGPRLHNSAAVVYPSGFLTVYRKTHLFFEESDFFTPGEDLPPVVRTPQGLRVGVMICFDWHFPEVARHLALSGADILAHPANLVLPHCPATMPVRCLENRVYAATANRVGAEARGGKKELRFIGRSQVLSPLGERLAALGEAETGVALAEIEPARARSKRVTDRDDLFERRRTDLFGEPLLERSRPGSRFAALRHEPAGTTPPHFDLLFELSGRLVAFRADSLDPLSREVVRAFDHRREYLEREGDLGSGRGSVRRVDEGTCTVQAGARLVQVEAHGTLLRGTLVFREREGDLWSVDQP